MRTPTASTRCSPIAGPRAAGQSRVAGFASRWPLPALLSWGAAWGLHALLLNLDASAPIAWFGASLLGAGSALLIDTPWRRAMAASGFPLSSLAAGMASALPAWAWLVPLAVLALAYPLRTWGDAPLFPTPTDGLRGLAQQVSLPADALVLDVGCGLGHGLRALRHEYPQARLAGIEWSAPIAGLARALQRLTSSPARIRRGDMWTAAWSEADLLYVFQRPESMARVWEKARAELRPGSTLVSLAFEVPGVTPDAVLPATQATSDTGARRLPVWIYRLR